MGYARYIGRVGALAVTLGVGVAMASTPGIAYADPSTGDSSSSASESSAATSSTTSSATKSSATKSSATKSSATKSSATKPSKGTDATPTDGSAGADSAASDRKPPSRAADESITNSNDNADSDTAANDNAPDVTANEDTSPADPKPHQNQRSRNTPANGDSAHQQVVGRSDSVRRDTLPKATDDDPTVAAPDEVEPQPQSVSVAAVAEQSFARSSAQARTTSAMTSAIPAPSVPQRPKTVLNLVSDFVASVLQPLLSPEQGSPIQIPILTAALSLVRNEIERIFTPRRTNVAPQQGVSLVTDPSAQPPLVADPTQHVLLIGVDGTNLSRILADDYNQNFFDLMDESTTAAASIVGHTTISNPSWTAILTGVWGERTGVINNVFTPWTYDRYSTVFNQLEALNSNIKTMAVADWDVINAIAAAGSIPVDENVYVKQVDGDTNWLETDDEVADRTIDAINGVGGPTPNFLFSYYVGVDENGHMYGGSSEEYKLAIRNMNDNLGDILGALALREAMGEDWTVMMVTDHGHQPQKGFGHGFQSPDETSTFVIAEGTDFGDGLINPKYQIVDTTPTVVSLFGGTPKAGSDGVPLMTLNGDDVDPDDLKLALELAIAKNKSPDILTNVALGLRTIVGTVPYYIFTFGNDFGAGLPSFLVLPAKIVFDGLYVATNVPAQIVAFLTGVSGARIFPLLPPAPPMFPPAQEASLPDSVILARCDVSGAVAESWCGQTSVA